MSYDAQTITVGNNTYPLDIVTRLLDAIETGNDDFTSYASFDNLLAVAVYLNRLTIVDRVLDYLNICDTVSRRERLAMYQMNIVG